MDAFVITISCIIMVIEVILGAYLVNKIIKHHKLSLKDTAIYPVVMILTMITLSIGYFNYDGNGASIKDVGSTLKNSFDIIKLSIDTELSSSLIHNDKASNFLFLSYVGELILSGLALISISVSLLFVIVKNFFYKRQNKKIEELDYVFGFNNDCKEYLKNYHTTYPKGKANHKTYVVIDNSGLDKFEEEKFFLSKNHIPFIERPCSNKDDLYKTISNLEKKHIVIRILTFYKKIFKAISKLKKKKDKEKKIAIKVLTFYDEDKKNFEFVKTALEYLKNNNDKEFIVVANIEQERFLNNMLFTNKLDRKAKGLTVKEDDLEVEDESKGKITIYNKYDLMAHDFAKHHNFAQYLPKEFINEDLTIKDADINLYVLGFGKVNQRVLRDILVCNQFVEKKNGKLLPKRMNVVIYDSKETFECFELINGLFKYDKASYQKNPEWNKRYLDLPEDYVSHREFRTKKSIYADDFVKSLFDEINNKCKVRNQINYFLISIGSDFENSDIAVKLRNNCNHIKSEKYKAYNTYFIRTKDKSYDVKEDINSFGSDQDVLTYKNIIGNEELETAETFHKVYNSEKGTNENNSWEGLSPIKRKSNVYSVYSLYFKLSLLLKFYKPVEEENLVLKNKEEKDAYDLNMMKTVLDILDKAETESETKVEIKSETKTEPTDIDEKYKYEVINGNFDIKDVLAFIEHEKWNAYELSQGVLPMSKPYCWQESKKSKKIVTYSYDELYHLAIASSDGLKDYYKYVIEIKDDLNKNHGCTIGDPYADVIKYDYVSINAVKNDINSSNIQMKEVYLDIIEYYKKANKNV